MLAIDSEMFETLWLNTVLTKRKKKEQKQQPFPKKSLQVKRGPKGYLIVTR